MHTLRIHCTGRPGAELKSVVGTCPAAAWDADDLTISVWLGDGTQTAGVPDAFDISTIETLRLEARADATTEEMYFNAKEISSFTECTYTEFKDAEGEHGSFVLTGTEMNLGDAVDSIWISITAELTDGTRHTFAAGTLSISHSGDSTAQGPVADPVTPYARYGFKNVAVSGQTTVTADTREDTLTLVAGTGVTLTTSGNSITIAASGSGTPGGGTVTSVSVTTANGVSGTVANSTSTPAITLTLGAITPTSVNGLTVTTTTGTLTIANGKTLTASNTLTIAGTDGSTLNIGTGGTLGTAAFTASSAYQPIDADLTAIAALSGTNTIYYRSAANTWSAVTIGSGLSFSGGTLSASGGGGSVAWGGITGTLSDQTDLQTALNGKLDDTEVTLNGTFDMIPRLDSSGNLLLASGGFITGNAGNTNGKVTLYSVLGGATEIIGSNSTITRTWDHPDTDGIYASQNYVDTFTGSSNITSLGTITSGVWNGTAIAIANGGTGATDAATARSNLGVLAAASNLSDVSDVTTARGNLAAAGTGAANTFTAQNIFNLAPRVPTTDLASGTALTIGAYYYKAISADLGPLTFSGTPAEGSTILLHLEVSGTRTVTFPASYRNGEAVSTITSLLFPAGLYLMGWQYRNSKWVLSDSLGALYNSTASDPGASDDANDGYVAGKSIWINTSTGRTFICRDATATAAVWECINREKIAIGIACSDETTALTTGTAKATFRMPYAFTLTEVRATVTTAPTGSTLIVDINDGGTTIMSTNKLSIDASEKTSTTAATAAGITDTALADDAEITIDIDQVGSTIAGAGLKVWLIGYRSAA